MQSSKMLGIQPLVKIINSDRLIKDRFFQASNAENVAGLGRPNIEISQPPNNNTPTTMKINNAAGKPGNRMSVKGRSRYSNIILFAVERVSALQIFS